MGKRRERKENKKKAQIDISENPDYKAVYASGVFGGLDPNDGRIIFFLDRIKPKMKGNPRGAMELEKINRELQVEVHMSPPQFMSVAKWMTEHAQRFQKEFKSKRPKDTKSEETEALHYIG